MASRRNDFDDSELAELNECRPIHTPVYTQAQLDAAIELEREACAKIAETTFTPTEHGRWDTGYVNAGIGIAAAIRNQDQG